MQRKRHEKEQYNIEGEKREFMATTFVCWVQHLLTTIKQFNLNSCLMVYRNVNVNPFLSRINVAEADLDSDISSRQCLLRWSSG